MGSAQERERYWRGHVEAWRTGGGSQGAYCRAQGLSSNSFGYWLRRFGKETLGKAEPVRELTLVAATVRLPARPPVLAVEHAGGWRLCFGELPPADWLGRVLRESA